MRKLLTALLVPIMLTMSACETTGTGTSALTSAPAPLAHTTIDDTALDAAWRSFDLGLDAINLMTDQGLIKPGTPKAVAIAGGIRKVLAGLTAAEKFAAAGSTTDYLQALADTKAAIAELRTVLKG